MLLPRTRPDQRVPFYEDVEALLCPGFLTHPIRLNGTRISLRTLSSGDSFMLRARAAGGTDLDWKVWTVASSIWMLNGFCLLGNVDSVPRLAHSLRQMPRAHLDHLFHAVLGLLNRQRRAVEATEAYCYELGSRYKWKTYGGVPPTSQAGVPGAESLGSNPIQQMWVAYNTVEDQRAEERAAWEGFKLVAMTNAPKGVRKLDQRDTRLHQNELDRRQQVMDVFFYLQIGILTPEMLDQADSGLPQAFGPKSVEQLEQEMKMWVAGEQDFHDNIVEQYKQWITDQQEAERAERAERAEALRREAALNGFDLRSPTRMVGYTPEQVARRLRDRGPGLPGARTFYEEPKQGKLYRRYLSKPEQHGLLEVRDGQLVAPKANVDLSPPGQEELDDDRKPLYEQVQRRSVPYRVLPDRR